MRAQARSLRTHDSARALAGSREAEVVQREATLIQTIAARTSLAEERRAHLVTLSRPIPPESPQAHVRRPHRPHLDVQQRRTRFLKLWAAVSTPLLLASVIVVLVASPLASITTVAVLAAAFIGVEAIARRRLLSFLASLVLFVVGIALITGFILLLLRHWRTAISLLLGTAALVLLIGNLRNLRRG